MIMSLGWESKGADSTLVNINQGQITAKPARLINWELKTNPKLIMKHKGLKKVDKRALQFNRALFLFLLCFDYKAFLFRWACVGSFLRKVKNNPASTSYFILLNME